MAKIKKIRGYQLALRLHMPWSEFQKYAATCGVHMSSAQNSLEQAQAMALLAQVSEMEQNAQQPAPQTNAPTRKQPPQLEETPAFRPIPVRYPSRIAAMTRRAQETNNHPPFQRKKRQVFTAPPAPIRRLQMQQYR